MAPTAGVQVVVQAIAEAESATVSAVEKESSEGGEGGEE